MITKNIKPYFIFFTLIIIGFFYIFDLWNIDALRQGTEGFYLQISKEMFDKNSFLTPYYHQVRHWSKPPLHFLFPFPFYATGLWGNLFSARLSIALLSIFLIYMTSRWIFKNFKIEQHTTLLFFAASIGMIKYSRIFMMEIPLTLLTFVGTLYFYDFYHTANFKKVYLPLILISSSVLIKGPVSLVLFGSALFVYLCYRLYLGEKPKIKLLILFFGLCGLLSSLWFIVSYLNYGKEFFDYFFLRENMGKFDTKSYPIRHVFQGLILFCLPWSFFAFNAYKSLSNSIKVNSDKEKIIFLLINAVLFFVIWLIPTQRSHHYAMPSVPFFLTLLLVGCVRSNMMGNKSFLFKIPNYLYALFSASIILILSVATYYIDVLLPEKNLSFFMVSSLIILTSTLVIFFKFNNFAFKSLSALIFLGWTWVFIAPQFVPPLVPQKVVNLVGEKKLTAYIRKPYFLEEALGRSFDYVSRHDFINHTQKTNTLFLVNYDDFARLNVDQFSILHTWQIWKRRTRLREVISALRINDISSLKQKYVLFKRK